MMTDKEMIAEIAFLVGSTYDPETNGQGWWETGNFDDTFYMGVAVGENEMAYKLATILGIDLEPMKDIEV